MPIDHDSVKLYAPTIDKVIRLVLEQKRPIDQADMVGRFATSFANRLIHRDSHIPDKELTHLVQIFTGVIESKYRLHHYQHFQMAAEFNHILSRVVVGVLGKIDLKDSEVYGFMSYLRQRLVEVSIPVTTQGYDPYIEKGAVMARGVIADIVRETEWMK
jgi:hypothetical protein